MIQDIGKSRYRNEYKKTAPKPDSKVLGYREREFLVREKEGKLSFLRWKEAVELLGAERAQEAVYLFSVDGTEYFWLPELSETDVGTQAAREKDLSAPETDSSAPETDLSACDTVSAERGPLVWRPIEWLRTARPREEAFAGVTGYQLSDWYESRRFCPRCAHPMVHDERERMMRCPACGQMEYPKISPAVIVAVTDGDRLLLTKYAGGGYRKYALIAGFAEIGETIEETVAREVMEETGLRVKNLRYYKSQPWSFSGTLLMGFFAELDGDPAIRLDRTELSEAVWCPRGEVPEDDGVSLTREMMRVFREGGY